MDRSSRVVMAVISRRMHQFVGTFLVAHPCGTTLFHEDGSPVHRRFVEHCRVPLAEVLCETHAVAAIVRTGQGGYPTQQDREYQSWGISFHSRSDAIRIRRFPEAQRCLGPFPGRFVIDPQG